MDYANLDQGIGRVSYDMVWQEKAQGALLGAAIGDALGWPHERRDGKSSSPKYTVRARVYFQPWYWRAGGRFNRHEEKINAGEYSDDTQLLLATARAIHYGSKWRDSFYYQELPLWLLYERGGGSATKAAAEAWAQGSPPWSSNQSRGSNPGTYFQAGGNGAAMRVLPHVLVPGRAREEVQRDVLVNSIATHGHPRALVGALVYAEAVWHAVHLMPPLGYGAIVDSLLENAKSWYGSYQYLAEIADWWEAANIAYGGQYPQKWSEAVSEMIGLLELIKSELAKGTLANTTEVLARIGCFDRNTKGSGVATVAAAVYLGSQYAADPVTGILEAAYAEGADTDTIASMLGGVLGAIHGIEWLRPEWSSLQDFSYIKQIASITATSISTNEYPAGGIKKWTKKDSSLVIKALGSGSVDHLDLGPLGKAQVHSVVTHISNMRSKTAISWKLVSEHGQTIYIKHFEPSRTQEYKGVGSAPTYESGQNPARRVALLLGELSTYFPPDVQTAEALRFVASVIDAFEDQRPRLGDRVLAAQIRNDKRLWELMQPALACRPRCLKDDQVVKICRTVGSRLYEGIANW
ncbi:ADP-ribosylglycohydrolase family protein [Neomoorella thermoacetica]|uniref:ADP-ribosylglycohydrolase family protein n=1 Tax=Neomoorella thermoacetica TaxID=1525 RepID=UPI0030CA74B8